jgi:hypothetical protein
MRPVETIQGMREGDAEEWRKEWIWYIVKTLVRAAVYPKHNNNNWKLQPAFKESLKIDELPIYNHSQMHILI